MWDYEDTHMLIARMGSLEFRVAFLQTEIKKMFQVSSGGLGGGGVLIIWSSMVRVFQVLEYLFLEVWLLAFCHDLRDVD